MIQQKWKQSHGYVWVVMALIITLTAGVAYAGDGHHGREDDRRGPYAIGLWGDLPYSTLQATVGVPNLIADMNSQKLAFTVHDGDLKSGSSECTDAVYQQALGFLAALKAPAAFTPGDNDWTDCDRVAGYNSLAQLDKERALFFSKPYRPGDVIAAMRRMAA